MELTIGNIMSGPLNLSKSASAVKATLAVNGDPLKLV